MKNKEYLEGSGCQEVYKGFIKLPKGYHLMQEADPDSYYFWINEHRNEEGVIFCNPFDCARSARANSELHKNIIKEKQL